MAQPPVYERGVFETNSIWQMKTIIGSEGAEELDEFEKHDTFKVAKEERLVQYKSKLMLLQKEFDRGEDRHRDDILKPFAFQIHIEGLENARKKVVPAYMFQRFRELPKEIRLMIWSLALKALSGSIIQTRIIIPINADYSTADDPRKVHCVDRSSLVFSPPFLWARKATENERIEPTLGTVCSESRALYLQMYARLPSRQKIRGRAPITLDPYDTVHNQFYMAEARWTEFKILIDMVIMANTTRPIPPGIARDVAALLNIRHLIMDVAVFGDAPADMWTHFPRLASLTIVFYPSTKFYVIEYCRYADGDDVLDHVRSGHVFKFFEPYPKSKMGRRAATILDLATKSFAAVLNQNPAWKKPELKAAYRFSGDWHSDNPVAEAAKMRQMREAEEKARTDRNLFSTKSFLEQESTSHTWPSSFTTPYSEYDDDYMEDDSDYLQALPANMSHPPVPEEQIKRWKQQYLSSLRLDSSKYWPREGEKVQYYTDSEGEMDDERPYEPRIRPRSPPTRSSRSRELYPDLGTRTLLPMPRHLS